jgi:hypothetical protein
MVGNPEEIKLHFEFKKILKYLMNPLEHNVTLDKKSFSKIISRSQDQIFSYTNVNSLVSNNNMKKSKIE